MGYVLLTNDDGVDSPALLPFARAIDEIAPLKVVVPSEERSWIGKAITRFDEVRVERTVREGVEIYVADGYPADCTQLRVHSLFGAKPDMVLSGMTMTLSRNLKVAFVGPYYISGKGILTKAQTIGALQATEGLNKPEFKIAALKGSTSQKFVEDTAPKAVLVTTKSYDEAVEMLFQDKIDALIADYPFCAFTAFRYEDKGLIAGQSKLTFEPLGIAVSEDALLINWLQNFMMALEGSGQMKIMNQRWFQDGSWIKELP